MRAWPSWCAQVVWAITNTQGSEMAIDQSTVPALLEKGSPDKSAIGSEMVSTLTVLNNPQSRLKPSFSIFIPKIFIFIHFFHFYPNLSISSNSAHFHLIVTAVAIVVDFLRVWRLQLRREPIVKFTARHNLWKGFRIWIFWKDYFHFNSHANLILKDCFSAHGVSHCMTAPLQCNVAQSVFFFILYNHLKNTIHQKLRPYHLGVKCT